MQECEVHWRMNKSYHAAKWLASNNPPCQITQLCQSQMWWLFWQVNLFFPLFHIKDFLPAERIMRHLPCHMLQLWNTSSWKHKPFQLRYTLWSDSRLFSFHISFHISEKQYMRTNMLMGDGLYWPRQTYSTHIREMSGDLLWYFKTFIWEVNIFYV